MFFGGNAGVGVVAHGARRIDTKVGVDQLALDLPREIVLKRFHQEQIAGLADDG
jgi:hypothetical protein